MPVLDYCYVAYTVWMPLLVLYLLWTRCIMGHYVLLQTLRHYHCVLYNWMGWSSLSLHRYKHWYLLIYICIAGLVPPYLQQLTELRSNRNYSLLSKDLLLLSKPSVQRNGQEGLLVCGSALLEWTTEGFSDERSCITWDFQILTVQCFYFFFFLLC